MLLVFHLLIADPRGDAIVKAMRFLDQTASTPDHFKKHGDDLVFALSSIARTSRDPALRELAQAMGERHARAWRRLYPAVPANASADTVVRLTMGDYSAALLGVRDPAFTQALRAAAKRYSVRDYLGYDPSRGPPTSFDEWSEALIITYFGDQAGITLGTTYPKAARAMPKLERCEDRDVFFAFTHVVYTQNGYGERKLPKGSLAREIRCIKAYLPIALRDNDPEVVGEALDTMKALGLPEDRAAIDFLLKTQRADGSWADADAPITQRYHSAWTGIDGLRDYLFQ